LVLSSEQGLELVDAVGQVVQQSRGRLTVVYVVDRTPLVSNDLMGDAAAFARYAESWGSKLLRRAAERLPDDMSVTTQLLVDSYDDRQRPEQALARAGYELVIVERHPRIWRGRARRLERAFRGLDSRLVVV
jgi:hypothetical protein